MVLWGYQAAAPGAKAPANQGKIDWARVQRHCTMPPELGGLGMTLEEYRNLTGPQLMAKLTEPRCDSAEEFEKIKNDRAGEIFDKIAKQHDFTPAELASLPEEALLREITEAIGPYPIKPDINAIRPMLKQWIDAQAA
jgi:hypothetical protein